MNKTQQSQKINRKSLVAGIAIKAGNILYFHKRTERVIAALFIVTDLLPDDNPIRHRIRQVSVDLMAFLVSFQSSFVDEGEKFIQRYQSLCLEIVSLLEIGEMSGQITNMNCRLVSEEIERLVLAAERMVSQSESFPMSSKVGRVLDKDDTVSKRTDFISDMDKKDKKKSHVKSHKGHIHVPLKSTDAKDVSNVSKDVSNSRESRRSAIISLLKDGRHLSVKDFSNVIPGVSEKTIQRELLSMVEDGVLNKEGERRWSRYFVASPKIAP